MSKERQQKYDTSNVGEGPLIPWHEAMLQQFITQMDDQTLLVLEEPDPHFFEGEMEEIMSGEDNKHISAQDPKLEKVFCEHAQILTLLLPPTPEDPATSRPFTPYAALVDVLDRLLPNPGSTSNAKTRPQINLKLKKIEELYSLYHIGTTIRQVIFNKQHKSTDTNTLNTNNGFNKVNANYISI